MSGDEIIEIEKSSPKSIPGPVIIDINKLGNDIKEGFLEYQKNEHQNKLKITETTLQDRKHLISILLCGILVVFLGCSWLAYIKVLDPVTFSFLLGTIVGSLASLIVKLFPPFFT